MSTKTTIAAVQAVSPVIVLLLAANEAEGTMLEKAKAAAEAAQKEFDKKLKPAENVRAIQTKYKETLAKCGQSTNRFFANFLWLLAAPNEPISYTEKGATVQTKAADVVKDGSRRAVQAAAQAVKENLGVAKAPRGKTAPAAPVASTTAHAANAVEAALNKAAIDAQFWKVFEEKLHSSGELAKVVAKLEEAGYKVTKREAKQAGKADNGKAPRQEAAKEVLTQLSA